MSLAPVVIKLWCLAIFIFTQCRGNYSPITTFSYFVGAFMLGYYDISGQLPPL